MPVHRRVSPQHQVCRYPFEHIGRERNCESKVSLPKNTTQCSRPGLEPRPLDVKSSALTMRPPCLHLHQFKLLQIIGQLEFLFCGVYFPHTNNSCPEEIFQFSINEKNYMRWLLYLKGKQGYKVYTRDVYKLSDKYSLLVF